MMGQRSWARGAVGAVTIVLVEIRGLPTWGRHPSLALGLRAGSVEG